MKCWFRKSQSDEQMQELLKVYEKHLAETEAVEKEIGKAVFYIGEEVTMYPEVGGSLYTESKVLEHLGGALLNLNRIHTRMEFDVGCVSREIKMRQGKPLTEKEIWKCERCDFLSRDRNSGE